MPELSFLPPGISASLLRWVVVYAVALFTWAIASTWVTIDARVTFGKSKVVRWSSIALGILLFVVIPATEPRWILPASLLILVVPILYGVLRFYRRGGTGLLRATTTGAFNLTVFSAKLAYRGSSLVATGLWGILLAILRLDWQAVRQRTNGLRQQLDDALRLVRVLPPSEKLIILDQGGKPVDLLDDPQFADFPKSTCQSVLRILQQAHQQRAEEVRVAPGPSGTWVIQYAVDGDQANGGSLSRDEGPLVLNAIKTLAAIPIAPATTRREGRFSLIAGDDPADIVVAIAPSDGGEAATLRSLGRDRKLATQGLAELGMDDRLRETVRQLLGAKQGLILFAGPRGSGKSTSLYAAMSEIDPNVRSIATVEAAPKYAVEHVTQVHVQKGDSGAYRAGLETAMFHEPEVLVIRDIGDRETAEQALKAAFAGHLVLAGFPAKDTVDALEKLTSLGVDRGLLKLMFLGVVSQRLARVLCPECKTVYEPSGELRQKLGIPPGKSVQFQREKGCPQCLGKGYRGRTGVFECLITQGPLRESLFGGTLSTAESAKLCRSNMFRSLRQSILGKLAQGITSVNEAARVLK